MKEDKEKRRKLNQKILLNRNDFLFIDKFCKEYKIREGCGIKNNISYLINCYKLWKRKK